MGFGSFLKKATKTAWDYSPMGLMAGAVGIGTDSDGGGGSLAGSAVAPSFTPRSFEYTAPELTPLEDIETGGQSARRLLTSTLEEAKRRARLTGRSLSPGEVEGLTRGHFAGAEGRLAQRKGLALAKRGQEISVRGQDIQAGLAYKGLESREAMHEATIAAQKYTAEMGAETQRYVTGKTSGFFGGGRFLGLGF